MQVLSAHFKTSRLAPLALSLVLFFGFASVTLAASVDVSPSTGTYSVGQSFTATIQVNPQGKSVNAVEAKMAFDNLKLSVVSVSKTGSVFSLWTTEPTFSNTAGTIDFGGGSPTPFTTRSNLITVTFKVLKEGSASVSVSSGSVLAADGLGTDVYTSPVNATYTATAATTPTPNPTPTETEGEPEEESTDATITFGDPPRAPEAGSTVFLDPEVWYPTKIGVFTWSVPFDVDVMKLDIATSSEAEPVTEYDPPIEQLSLSDELLKDGIQYLTMQYKNTVGW